GQNQPRRDDFGLKIGKLSHRTSIKDGLGRHIGSCGPLNRNFLSEYQHYQNILIVSHQGVLSLLIARLIGMPAESMWHFRVDQGCWSAIDINQKFATLRVLNSRAIGVENA
ncbi:histidine phosphatase family protein, partial [Escherichia coli]|uniref:histidine phosphatase family protein n=1 Tax=Escherichia coli TaxID=562 RepID=UPI00241F01C0